MNINVVIDYLGHH